MKQDKLGLSPRRMRPAHRRSPTAWRGNADGQVSSRLGVSQEALQPQLEKAWLPQHEQRRLASQSHCVGVAQGDLQPQLRAALRPQLEEALRPRLEEALQPLTESADHWVSREAPFSSPAWGGAF